MAPPVTATILPSQVIQKAIDFITAKAWCRGQEPSSPLGSGRINHARDVVGTPVPLLWPGEDLNPDVYAVTAYGSISVVLADRNTFLSQPQLLWDTVRDVAIEATPDIAVGGENYLHPIHNLNEREGQTEANIIAFLSTVKARLVATEAPVPKEARATRWADEPGPMKVAIVPNPPVGTPMQGPGPTAPVEPFEPPATDMPAEPSMPGRGGRPQPSPTSKAKIPPRKTKTPVKRIKR